MIYTVYVRPEAENDIAEAAFWYEKQLKHLGDDFLDEIQNIFKIISENPYIYAVVHRQVRRVLIYRFPFAIYYRIEQEFTIVIAVIHSRRYPKRWQKRT